jgi:hypothetical protein
MFIFQHIIHKFSSNVMKFTVLSPDPVARYLPSRENATLYTHPIILKIYIYIYMYVYLEINLYVYVYKIYIR